jgi:hypothetical protein
MPKVTPHTVFNQDKFSLTLTGIWTETLGQDGTSFIYIKKNGSEQLTVSIFDLEPGLPEVERKSTMEKLVLGLREVDKEAAYMSHIGYRQLGDLLSTLYNGRDEAHQRRFADIAVAGIDLIYNLYYEAVGQQATLDFDQKFETIFQSFQIHRDTRDINQVIKR